MPKVSVLMCTFNDGNRLKNSIDSIIEQTFTDFELVIVNDGSTDDSHRIINSYNDNRIRVINNEKNLGLSKSLNRGLKLCKGDLIARMDADDISMDNRLEKQYRYLKENKGVDVLGGQAIFIDSDGNKIDFEHKYPISNELIKWELLREVPFCHPSVMFRKYILNKVGTYNEGFRYAQDFELWKRIANYGYRFSNLEDKIIYYRRFKSGNFLAKKTEQKKAHIKILSDSFKTFSPMLSTRLVYYYYYGQKRPLKNKHLLIGGVKLSIELYHKFIASHTLSKSDQKIISEDTALKILNFAKVQKHLPLFSRLSILILCYKIYSKIITHYQFRRTLGSILITK